jgi:hypothetical protein
MNRIGATQSRSGAPRDLLWRCGNDLLILARFAATGGHWAVLQSIAWSGMLIKNLQTDSWREALVNNFRWAAPLPNVPANQDREKGREEIASGRTRQEAEGVSVSESNKPFTSMSVAGGLSKEAAAMAGRYVPLTNVSFTSPKIEASGTLKVKCADSTEATLLVSKGGFDLAMPKDDTDVFGVVVKSGSECA